LYITFLRAILRFLLEDKKWLFVFKVGSRYQKSACFCRSVHVFRQALEVNSVQDVNCNGTLRIKENERPEKPLANIRIQQFTNKPGFLFRRTRNKVTGVVQHGWFSVMFADDLKTAIFIPTFPYCACRWS
jgi:hypothetical protein